MIIIVNNKRYGERGKELKVLHHANTAAIRDCNLWQSAGNPWQIAGTILSRKYLLLTLATLLLWLPSIYNQCN
jgi:hypothetical protein